MYVTGCGYGTSSRLMLIGPQSAGGAAGGSWAGGPRRVPEREGQNESSQNSAHAQMIREIEN